MQNRIQRAFLKFKHVVGTLRELADNLIAVHIGLFKKMENQERSAY